MGKFRQHQSGTLAIAILLALSLSGCESTGNWLKGRKTAEPEPVSADAPSSDIYLAELSKLVNSDPAAQTEIFLDAKDRAELTPSPGTRLLYALLLATPGHAETDPLLAQVILRDLLTKAEVMTPNEASLASIPFARCGRTTGAGERSQHAASAEFDGSEHRGTRRGAACCQR